MSTFEILLSGDDDSHVVAADAYAQEGPLTTFFCCDSTHVRLDSWAERLASFRSADIRAIRRLDDVATLAPAAPPMLGLVETVDTLDTHDTLVAALVETVDTLDVGEAAEAS